MNISTIEAKSINTIRLLSVDAIQKANTGHPGMPMGMAPVAYLLYKNIMNHNPQNSKWLNRDRFVMSGGHGSMLLYSVLHLSGYDVSLDDLKNFRQWGSKTPGHPEFGHTDGVETTTGPLGQGLANAIGMSVAQKHLAAIFNKDGFKILDHFIYAEAGDGDLMEGLSHEASSFAGHNKLGNLILFYDSNKITIDGNISLSNSDDAAKRFESYNWHVQTVEDANDLDALKNAVESAKNVTDKPSIIITKSIIGFGSPNKQGTSSSHGSPLGDDEIVLVKRNFGFPEDEKFYVPTEVTEHFAELINKGAELENKWNDLFAKYSEKYPEEAKLFIKAMNNDFGDDWKNLVPKFENYGEGMATRNSSQSVLNAIAPALPLLFGGSADLTPSNNTDIKGWKNFTPETPEGGYIRYGIREFAMAAIMNGMAIYGGCIPYGGTFLVFSDYLRPALRIASLSKIKMIYVFTHDSIGVGEDGPTHQPVEHFAALRSIPGVVFLRPADANETSEAWSYAIEHKDGPVAIALTRQKLTILDRTIYAPANGLQKGAYVIKDVDGTPDLIIMASGSELAISIKAAEELDIAGIKSRVVSFPSFEIFDNQSDEYKDSVLPKTVRARISVEAAVKFGWEKYVGLDGISISLERFGASGPEAILFEKFGFTVANIVAEGKKLLGK
ncbi:MAG: transketolase [Bacteroidetes bacterium]|nr:transketolase [Bacteroidota bacterium]MBU1116097.1 transketolase [Bacteroidota bacterium]MBU1799479.1 transketolase [Bacteroidota bacterium]